MFESWGYKFRCQSLVLCILFLINISRIADSCQRTLKIWLKSNWNSANRYAIYLSLCFAVFFPENFNWYLFIYIYNFFVCWSDFCYLLVFALSKGERPSSLAFLLGVGIRLTYLGRRNGSGSAALATNYPMVGPGCHSLFHINIRFSLIFFCAPQPWGGNTVEKRVAVTWGFPYSFAGCSLSSCSFRYLSGTLFQFAFDESQNAAAWAQTKAMQKNKGEKSPSHFCIHPHFFRPLSPSSCVLFAQLGSNYG